MGFKDYKYERPDFEQTKKTATVLIQTLKNSVEEQQAIKAVKEINTLQATVLTANELAAVRHSIDTTDEFYTTEDHYWNEYGPLYQELWTSYYEAVLNSDHQEALHTVLPETFFQLAENQLKAFDPSIIDLLQQENKLVSSYDDLIASAELEFNGESLNLSQLTPHMESVNRQNRKTANETYSSFFETNEQEVDQIYDELVKIRDKIAKQLGFRDFVELGYIRMNRFDYNREMVQVYREEVLKEVVPVANKLYERQAKRIDLETPAYYDVNFNFKDGNPEPQGNAQFIIDQGKKMYHELSPETAEFIDYMLDNDLTDLLSKKGKQSGGYCTYIPNYQAPFIFSNFNGTSGDVDVLTHEAGHAFQSYQSRWIDAVECVFPTFESAEIHSMSMEFFTWPWMELFFKDQTEKYQFTHLSGTLQFLPYGVLVDHFQHEVYEHPEMTPAERKAVWRKLEQLYCPHKDYSENSFLDKGTWWFRQGHIFSTPFYYIDYTLAQVCAFQFWKRDHIDHDKTAWSDYLKICHTGGTKSFLQIVQEANLNSPFEKGALTDVVQAIDRYLAEIEDEKFLH